MGARLLPSVAASELAVRVVTARPAEEEPEALSDAENALKNGSKKPLLKSSYRKCR